MRLKKCSQGSKRLDNNFLDILESVEIAAEGEAPELKPCHQQYRERLA
jgi:hypothetical protein